MIVQMDIRTKKIVKANKERKRDRLRRDLENVVKEIDELRDSIESDKE